MPGLGSKAIRSGKKARRPKRRKFHNPLGLSGECWNFLSEIINVNGSVLDNCI